MSAQVSSYRKGPEVNEFDYDLQVWVLNGVIQPCGHPTEMKARGCCNAARLAGRLVADVKEG